MLVFQAVAGLYYIFWLAVTDMLCTVCSYFLTGSVDDIIDHYKKEQIVEGYNLKEPVSVQVSKTVYWHYWVCLMIFDLIFQTGLWIVFVLTVAPGTSSYWHSGWQRNL